MPASGDRALRSSARYRAATAAGAELALDGSRASARGRAPLVLEEVADRGGQRHRLLPRARRATSSPNTSLQLDAARVVGRDHRRAGGQRLDRDRRQRLEQRRQHEQIGGGAVARDRGVVHQAGERDVPLDARRSRDASQLAEQRPGAADHQPRVGVRADDLAHRLEQEALPGERMQPLDVDQQVTRCRCPARARSRSAPAAS